MKDDFQIPNLGQAPDAYEIGFFNRFARNIEMTLMTLRGKGRGIFSDVQTDQIEVANGATIAGDTAIGGALTVGSNLGVTGTSNLKNTNVVGTMAATGAVTGASATATGAVQGATVIATTSMTTPVVITPAIQFPATQVPSANVNTLDDYEEGTFTPTITAASGTLTAYTATGNYVKIGRVVYWWISIAITTNGTAASYLLTTLPPFTAAAAATGVGREVQSIGFVFAVSITAATANAIVIKYDNTYPGGSNTTLVCNGQYLT